MVVESCPWPYNAAVQPDNLAWLTQSGAAGRGFIEHFFQCTDCSEHFLQLLGDKAADAVQSREDAMLWMWRSHNAVRSM